MRKLWSDKRGNMFIFTMVIMFFLFSLSMVMAEVYRLHNLHAHIEYSLQRAVNTAVEDAMEDTYRMDKLNKLDTAKARNDFYTYLSGEMGLNASYQMKKDGVTVYTLTFDNVTATVDPPSLQVKGKAKVKSVFPFLTQEIEMPFNIQSKNGRVD